MIYTSFSFYDAKVGIFHPPFHMLHRGQALRAAQELGGDLSTQIGRHPNDFVLFEIGTFNDQTGAQETTAPVSLGPVASLLEQPRLPFRDAEAPPASTLVRSSVREG